MRPAGPLYMVCLQHIAIRDELAKAATAFAYLIPKLSKLTWGWMKKCYEVPDVKRKRKELDKRHVISP